MTCWFREELNAIHGGFLAALDDDEKRRQHPSPEAEPGKPMPQEAPPAESPVPEIEPYQTPPTPTPDLPQPTA